MPFTGTGPVATSQVKVPTVFAPSQASVTDATVMSFWMKCRNVSLPEAVESVTVSVAAFGATRWLNGCPMKVSVPVVNCCDLVTYERTVGPRAWISSWNMPFDVTEVFPA
ncbi:MAG: hypothetical protein BWY66_00261 [bacterium ADurb.Bin374]|nr:MAG: hypothetical protein BWY66_00261 [bacterium ADurb.Bin374]